MVKLKYSEKNLSQYHVCPQKSHMDWPGIELLMSLMRDHIFAVVFNQKT